MSAPRMRVAGDTHVGKVRTTNEDSMYVDDTRGIYAVFDGMGGANAGDVASQTASSALAQYVVHHPGVDARELVEQAIQHACNAVFTLAQQRRELAGMGTTAVACAVIGTSRAVIGHAGDSRAYLLRAGRLQALTRDHTIVEELVERGLLSADEAERHPYKNVLSRNLGARAETKVDIAEVELRPGDRLLLCSDGLYGYAAADAIQYLLGSGDEPEHVARDLVELALRGGGGDNVTAIVIEAPAAAPTSTQVVRTRGAIAWWQRCDQFVRVARERGLLQSPLVRGLPPDEALDLVARSLCQAVYHDLEKSTGVNVWTFAQQIGGGWFERGGDWGAVRALVDTLNAAARTVIDDIRAQDAALGFLVDVAVSRALVVAELALGGLLAEQLRQVDTALIELHGAMHDPSETSTLLDGRVETVVPGGGPYDDDDDDDDDPTGDDDPPSMAPGLDDDPPAFVEHQTIPFLRSERPNTGPGEGADLAAAVGNTLTIARARTSPRANLVKQVLSALELIAADDSGHTSSAVHAAREFYGVRTVDERGVMPLFDALDRARLVTASSVHQISVASESTRAAALAAISVAHQRLVSAISGLVLEAVEPVCDRLRDAQAVTSQLRSEVASAERKRAELERRRAEHVDHTVPWEHRGNTEW